MSLKTARLNGTEDTPLNFEITGLSPASTLLWHLTRLKGLKVVAKKSWAMTDDFEAYFTYKNRLFIMFTPMEDVLISQIGQPPNNELFTEVELHVQKFSWLSYFLAPLAIVRFFFVPFNPSRNLLESQGIDVAKWWK